MDTKRATDITVVSYVFVLLFLTLSGTLDGALSEIAYIAAFLLPTLFGLLAARRLGVSPAPLKIKRAALPIVVHSVFPTVTLIMLISLLTSYILSLTGAKNDVTVYETLGENILRHALLPAILEEAAFRYLPLSVFGKGGRECVIVSSLSFAVIHTSLFQIPYAFIAGVIFICLDIIAESPLPSLILHTVNNLVSVIIIYYEAALPVAIAVGVLTALSAVFIFKNKKAYIEGAKSIFAQKSKLKLSYSLLVIVIPTMTVAILNLL